MNVFFLHYGKADPRLSRKMILSLAAKHSGFTLYQQMSEAPDYLHECSAVTLAVNGRTFSQYRCAHEIEAALHYGPSLSLDNDLIFTGDVSHVWKCQFDIALTERDNADPIKKRRRYVGGVTFTRNSDFWRSVQKALPLFAADPWDGIEYAMSYVAENGPFRVLSLPARVYNHAPATKEDTEGALVLHYRGDRKKWIL